MGELNEMAAASNFQYARELIGLLSQYQQNLSPSSLGNLLITSQNVRRKTIRDSGADITGIRSSRTGKTRIYLSKSIAEITRILLSRNVNIGPQ